MIICINLGLTHSVPTTRHDTTRYNQCGLILSQLPATGVKLERGGNGFLSFENEVPEQIDYSNPSQKKIIEFQPSDGESVEISLRVVDAATGGLVDSSGGRANDMSLVVQAGEFGVMSEILRSSIPELIGWTKLNSMMMDFEVERAVKSNSGNNTGGNSGGNSGGYSGGYNSDGNAGKGSMGGGNVPF